MSDYKKKYEPINCSFHDVLLEKATFRKVTEITYHTVDGIQKQTKNIIKDVYTKSSEEFMLLDNGEVIRLDHIVSVDGALLPETSCNVKKKG